MSYNIDFGLASAAYMIILYIFLLVQYSGQLERNRKFQKIALLVLLVDILDIVTAVAISYGKNVPGGVNLLLNMLYFMLEAIFVYKFACYVASYVHPMREKFWGHNLCKVICGIYLLWLLINAFTGQIFSFNEEGEYIHGIFYPLVFLIPFFYIVYAAVILIYNHKAFQMKQKVSLAFFIVLNIIGPLVQMMFFPNILLSVFTVTLAVFIMLFSLETPDYQKLMETMAELERLQKNLKQEVKRQTREAEERRQQVERLSAQIMKTLAHTIDAKDKYTNGHSIRVAEYSKEIARRLGKSEEEQQDIYYMGLLHDIGKIGIQDNIITKTSGLTDEEYTLMKHHPVIGADILKNMSEIPGIDAGARWHHEKYDGTGYPDGLKGEEIPEVARIIGVADAYDAMASKRSYRDVLPQEVVRAEIEQGKGTQFDPVFADKMLEMIDEDKEYQMREK